MRGALKLGDTLDVCVPTGNFGNIFAAYIAKLMGLPICKFVCASNVNNVLTEFLTTGTYDKNRTFHATISPSMDILISSNLERLLFLVAGSEKTAEYMEMLKNDGKYTVSDAVINEIKNNFIGMYADESETKATIKSTYENKNYLIDTHTSVAMRAAEKYIDAYKAERKVLVVSTASPYKFAKDVYLSITGNDCRDIEDTEALAALSALTGTEIPTPLASVLTKEILHPDIIDSKDMDNAVADFVTA
jgi:threonine synthase